MTQQLGIHASSCMCPALKGHWCVSEQKEEEERMAAEGSAVGSPAPKPEGAAAGPGPSVPSAAPSLVVVQNSLTVQAQAENFQRRVTVEDNPVCSARPFLFHFRSSMVLVPLFNHETLKT